ncbi:OmpA family protein [Flavobacterium sp. NRK F7]|uniref:OmpA family protein n=1 Tax=Flavobacterium sp. NRK F7 TaxID=2954930 RepID=UPI0020908241|nr:OmpA family protein [Flavobacterium sp. NRK F7]MCO6163850.1 OmpA family protein [Flavobacterium sp. NRK F7]
MKIKNCSIALLLLLGTHICNAQLIDKLKKKAERAAERTVERRVERETEKKTDQAMDSVFGSDKKKTKKEKKSSKESSGSSSSSSTKKGQDIVTGSSFFPNGDILFSDDFNQDNFGDFPANWDTNSGGEIIKVGQNKAFKLNPNGTYAAKTNKLPENYALEFDLVTENLDYKGLSGSQFGINFSSEQTLNRPKNGGKFSFSLWKGSNICNQINVQNWGKTNAKIDNNIPFKMQEKFNTTTHFTVVVNGNRLRVFIDNEKAIDLPSFLSNNLGNYIQFYLKGTDPKENHIAAIANVKITEEGEDLRSLILKGGFSTTKILFDSGSDKIKKESYEFLDKMAKVLQDDKTLRLNIIGHTDSDGDSVKNMTLSKSRAASVMNYFIDNKGLDKSRFMFQGRGENEPVAENNSAEGKAKNRRVEFQKI